MRTQLHLSCFAGALLVLLACRDREPDRAAADSLPAPAAQVDPVPEVPPNPVVNVPRPNVSPSAVRSEAARAAATPPPSPPPSGDTLITPAPPLDVRPSIPVDSPIRIK